MTKTSKISNIVIGGDYGHGTNYSTAFTRQKNGSVKKHQIGFVTGYNTARDDMFNLDTGETSSIINTSAFKTSERRNNIKFLNGGVDDFYVTYKNRKYWLGLSAHTRTETPIKVSNATRYNNERYMKLNILGSLSALINDGWKVAEKNNLYLAVGIPTNWYYGKTSQFEDLENFCKNIIGYTFGLKDEYSFEVAGYRIVPEGIGAYYNYIISDDMSVVNPSSDGMLIVDPGQGTLDTMIVNGYKVSQSDVVSDEKICTRQIFVNAANEINKQGFDNVEAESVFLSGVTSRYGNVSYDDLLPIVEGCTQDFLDKLSSNLTSTYSGKEGMFSSVLIVGGITAISERLGIDITDNVKYHNKEILVGGIGDNSAGFNKVYQLALAQQGVNL